MKKKEEFPSPLLGDINFSKFLHFCKFECFDEGEKELEGKEERKLNKIPGEREIGRVA